MLADGGWRVDVSVRSGVFQDRTTWFGVSGDAKYGRDPYEQPKPRHIFGVPDVFFNYPDWDKEYTEFATDVRPGINETEVWDINLRSEAKQPCDIEFHGLSEVPSGLAVYLLDDGAGRYVDLRKEAMYSLTPFVPITKLHILVGNAYRVKEKIDSALPREFALLPNYPNPFNPSTTIPVVVPKRGRVTLEIYNTLGQRVKQLVNAEWEAGIHYVEWAGTNESDGMAASGVYYCVLRAGTSLKATRTLVMLK